jgi:hypothetical protein
MLPSRIALLMDIAQNSKPDLPVRPASGNYGTSHDFGTHHRWESWSGYP